MTERVTFPSKTAEVASGELALPDGAGRAPAVLVIQEWWGVNDQIKRLTERWADEEGFVALAVDLYRGALARDAAEAEAMMTKLDRPRAMADIGGALDYLRAHPCGNGKVAVTGYCMGGGFAFSAALAFPGIGAVVPFYGLGPGGDWSKLEAPIQAHFAARDDWAKPSVARDLQEQLKALGKTMELHVYDADHAFCNDRRPEVYDAQAAALAWSRAVTFVKQHLA